MKMDVQNVLMDIFCIMEFAFSRNSLDVQILKATFALPVRKGSTFIWENAIPVPWPYQDALNARMKIFANHVKMTSMIFKVGNVYAMSQEDILKMEINALANRNIKYWWWISMFIAKVVLICIKIAKFVTHNKTLKVAMMRD